MNTKIYSFLRLFQKDTFIQKIHTQTFILGDIYCLNPETMYCIMM